MDFRIETNLSGAVVRQVDRELRLLPPMAKRGRGLRTNFREDLAVAGKLVKAARMRRADLLVETQTR